MLPLLEAVAHHRISCSSMLSFLRLVGFTFYDAESVGDLAVNLAPNIWSTSFEFGQEINSLGDGTELLAWCRGKVYGFPDALVP